MRTRGAGWGIPNREQVIPDWVAGEVTRILEENVQGGTGVAANYGQPAAGKTGTTTDHADAWFVGYTPVLSTAIWVGYPRAEIPMTNVHGIAVAGGTFPAEIWHDFMATASPGDREFPVPRGTPVWQDNYRGQYQYEGGSYDPYGYSSSSSQESTTTTSTTTTQAATTQPQQQQAPPPQHAAPQHATPTTSPATPVTPPPRHVPPPTD